MGIKFPTGVVMKMFRVNIWGDENVPRLRGLLHNSMNVLKTSELDSISE